MIVLLLCLSGVIAADAGERKKMSVLEGDSLTLPSNVTEVHQIDLMMWMYGSQSSIIAKLNGKTQMALCYDTDDGRFGDRLQLDNRTGSLTISDIRTKHSGDYQLKTISSKTSYESFSVTVYDVFFAGVTNARDGGSVTLHSGVSDIQKQELIRWMFGDAVIAEMDAAVREVWFGADAGLQERLQLDRQTGSLTISASRSADSGVYQLQISSSKETFYRRYDVFVAAPEAGLSVGVLATLICIGVLLPAAAAGVYYYRRKYSRLKDEKKTNVVAEGDSVTLRSGVAELRGSDRICWRFGPQDTVIAQICRGTGKEGDDERFRDRLQMNEQTGDLTIKDVRITHSGSYQMRLHSSRESKSRRFKVVLYVESLQVSEGETVCLDTGVGELHEDERVVWSFGSKDKAIIAQRDGQLQVHYAADGRFGDRLDMNPLCGLLRIINTKSTDSGVYYLKIRSRSRALYKMFRVTVWVDTVKVRVGDSVTLSTDVSELQDDSKVLWTHGNKDTCIAEINRASGNIWVYRGNDVRFRDRLKLDPHSGSLSIWNISAAHSDLYSLQMSSSAGTKCKRFALIAQETRVSVMEGDAAQLTTDGDELDRDALLLWMFGPEDGLIAKADKQNESICTYAGPDGRFEGRLQMDGQTGSLNITDVTDAHSGLYKLQIISSRETRHKHFRVTVRGHQRMEVSAEDTLNDSMIPLLPINSSRTH